MFDIWEIADALYTGVIGAPYSIMSTSIDLAQGEYSRAARVGVSGYALNLALRAFVGRDALFGARFALASGTVPYIVPVLAVTVAALSYEKLVNDPIRESHSPDSSWRGPFSSGFGTVV